MNDLREGAEHGAYRKALQKMAEAELDFGPIKEEVPCVHASLPSSPFSFSC
jgi:hypothetical protein